MVDHPRMPLPHSYSYRHRYLSGGARLRSRRPDAATRASLLHLPPENVANIGTGVLMGYKVFHFCDLTDPPKGL